LQSRKERRAIERKTKELSVVQSMMELANTLLKEMVKKEMMHFAKFEFSNIVKRIRSVKIKLAKISRMTKVEKYQYALITEQERKMSEFIENMTKRQRIEYDKQNRLDQKKLDEERQLRFRTKKLEEKKAKLVLKQQKSMEKAERLQIAKLAKSYRKGMLNSVKAEKLLLEKRYNDAISQEEKKRISMMIAIVNEKIQDFSIVKA